MATQTKEKPKGDYGNTGEAGYADPGYQSDGKPRYPLKEGGSWSEKRIRAAWSYINQKGNRTGYTASQLSAIEGRIKAAAKRVGIEIADGEAKNSADKGEPDRIAAFDMVGMRREEGDTVYRLGKIFEAGDYPDKQFAMTPEELWIAAQEFSEPVDLDLEHEVTILSGKLGRLVSVQTSQDDNELLGEVAIPKWLDEVLGPEPVKVSATWDRASRTLVGLALVLYPRVEDAAVMAAFSAAHPEFARPKHNTRAGQSHIQAIHDAATRAGAVCKAPAASMASSHEAKAFQAIHDMAVEHGAACDTMKDGETVYPAYYSDIRPRPGAPAKRGKKMTLKERILALFGEAEDDEAGAGGEGAETKIETPPTKPEKPPSVPPAIAAQMRAMQDQLAAQEARFAEQTKRRIEAEAENFAETLLRDGKLLPPEKPALLAAFIQAAHDDTAHEAKVTFGVGKDGAALEGGRVDALKALFAARSPHVLFSELSSRPIPVGATVLMNREEGKQDAAAVRAEADQLLATTDLGRQVLAERVRQTNGKGG